MNARAVVADASAVVDLLLGAPEQSWIREQLTGRAVVVPAHLGSEVLSALGRKHREGVASSAAVESMLVAFTRMPLDTRAVESLIVPAWSRRGHLRLTDALYVELAAQLDTLVVTTDRRLARASPLAVAPPP